MISPMTARRVSSPGMASAAGEPGWKRSVPKSPAETMKRPSPAASMRYSGQWCRSASAGPAARAARTTSIFPGAAVISAPGLEAWIERHAAIDEDAGAGDVVGLVRGKPGDHAADVVDLADA